MGTSISPNYLLSKFIVVTRVFRWLRSLIYSILVSEILPLWEAYRGISERLLCMYVRMNTFIGVPRLTGFPIL